MAFRALLTETGDNGVVASAVTMLEEDRLSQDNVVVGIDWPGFNHKVGSPQRARNRQSRGAMDRRD